MARPVGGHARRGGRHEVRGPGQVGGQDRLDLLFFSSRRRHTRCLSDWSSDVCSSDLERLVAKYMDEVAPTVEPAAVELDVQGEISGVAVRGRVDVLDVEGRLID